MSATITAISLDPTQIEIDKPLAEGVTEIKLTADKGATLIGYARVVNREANGLRLTLDSLPAGGTPEETKAFIAAEVRKWAPIIKAAKIQM